MAYAQYVLKTYTYTELLCLTVKHLSNNSVSVRIPEEDKTLLERVCKARVEDVSDFVRRSIRKELASLSFLSHEEKKCLGIKTESQNQCREG